MALIEVEDLVKQYKVNTRRKGFFGAVQSLLVPEHKIVHAVNHINFSIEKGEMVGFIGPNGAGKSTTVKMLTGILVPTSGEITTDGLSPHKNRKENAAKLGVVFGQRTQLWYDLPVIDTFDLLKHIYRIPEKTYKDNLNMFTELLEMRDFLNQAVRQLSLGQRMRADIAASMLHNPEIVYFDEPTIGLDVLAKERIRTFLKQINKERGTTMLFTTHDMQDIEKTCNRMLIIDHGALIYDGTVKQIKDRYGKERILEVDFYESYEDFHMPGIKVIPMEGNRKQFVFNKNEIPISKLISTLTQKYGVSDLTVKEPEIEGIIGLIYEGGIDYDTGLSGVC